MNKDNQSSGTPKLAIFVSVYHLVLLLVSGVATLYAEYSSGYLGDHLILVTVLSFGTIGGVINASRYVIFAVRHGTYESRRFLWQTLTPLHGAILASIGYVLYQGGIITLTSGVGNARTYKYFIMAVSFMIGFSSELFIKRLIKATESLFGESNGLD